MPRLTCPRCGLRTHDAAARRDPRYLVAQTCPRCASPLEASAARVVVDRHAAAVRSTLMLADQAAGVGDLAGALAWLRAVEAIGDVLPEGYLRKRAAWANGLAPAVAPTQERDVA